MADAETLRPSRRGSTLRDWGKVELGVIPNGSRTLSRHHLHATISGPKRRAGRTVDL